MNHALLAFLVVIAFLLAIAFFSMLAGQKRAQRRKLEEIREGWGKAGRNCFDRTLMESLSSYSLDKGEPLVDDITWHDLDLNRLYRDFNTARSSCGDCVIYDRLRNPSLAEDELHEINRLADYFDAHEDERVSLQLILADIGRDEERSIHEQLKGMKGAGRIGGAAYLILAVLTLADIVYFFFAPMIATILLFPLFGLNIYLSLKMKESTEAPIEGFRAVLALMRAADALEKSRIKAVETYTESLVRCRNELKAFRRGAFLVTGRNRYAEGPGEAILQYVKLFFHVDLIKFDQMLKAVEGHEKAIFMMMERLGFLDMAICVASYRRKLSVWCRPEFSQEKEVFLELENVAHPLIKEPVANSIRLKGGNLITGSNASGKSTFLRTVAVSLLMAQAFGTAPASVYRGNFFRVMTSMALTDNLENGESYYVVEIRSLKRILKAAEEKTPLLSIVDEVLRGTNTIERIASSSQILKYLLRGHVISLAATHDIELTYLLEHLYQNYHFEENVGDGDIIFDYKLKPGRSMTRNAIRLLEAFGYDDRIVEGAAGAAAHFEETGEWKL